MSEASEKLPLPSASVRYDLADGGFGIRKQFSPGYILAEQYGGKPDFSVVWSTEMGAVEVLERTEHLRPLRRGLDARGFVVRKNRSPLYTSAAEVVRIVLDAPDDILNFKAGTLSAVSLQWHAPRHQSQDYDAGYAEIAVMAASPQRAIIEPMIAATAIEAVNGSLSDSLDEFAAEIPYLQQA